MFEGEKILELIELFKKRHVKLYHSVQYLDFISYLKIGGIPSRSLMESCKLPMTALVSDENDHINNMWDKVFLNPLDFGEIFENGNGVPTVYGPIAFVFNPQALSYATDVAICLRSAGSLGFNRNRESLKSIDDVNRLFVNNCSDDPNQSRTNSRIKSSKSLCEEFKMKYASYPEISLTIQGNLLQFSSKLIEIIVDPYLIDGTSLIYKVSQKLLHSDIQTFPHKRRLEGNPGKLIPEIVDILKEGIPTVNELEALPNLSCEFKEWINKLKKNNLCQQWINYAKYLRNGTILPMLEEMRIK